MQIAKRRHVIFFTVQLLIVAVLSGPGFWAMPAWSQDAAHKINSHNASPEFALTYAAERAELAPGQCGCFWLQGGNFDASLKFFHGLGAVASISGGHASSIVSGTDLSTLTFLGGARYTSPSLGLHSGAFKPEIFAQALFGGIHGFDSVFPGSATASSSANSFAMQIGGGINLFGSHGLGVRALDMAYVRSSLPNSYGNSQNDFKIGAGIVYRPMKR